MLASEAPDRISQCGNNTLGRQEFSISPGVFYQ
jgi:hypothetical protein